MKTILTIFLFALTTTSMAATICPKGSQTLYTCTSNPQPGDQDFAARLFDTLAICKDASGTLMAFDKNKKTEHVQARTVTKPDGANYTGEAKGVELSLSVTTVAQGHVNSARLVINIKQAGVRAASTFDCKK